MTILEFWGSALITFGPALAMFILTIANDPIKIILLISASFFWLMSFLLVSICWSIMSIFLDSLIVAALIAVISQELFRYLFYFVIRKAEIYFDKMIKKGMMATEQRMENRDLMGPMASTSNNAIRIDENRNNNTDYMIDIQKRIPMSYVAGLGFGLMNGAFSMMNVLTDYIGPGTVGIKGDSTHFLLVSSLTASAFILLNVSWSILMSESIEKSNREMFGLVFATHLMATMLTFLNRAHFQMLSLLLVYALTIFSGCAAFKVAGFDVRRMLQDYNRSPRPV